MNGRKVMRRLSTPITLVILLGLLGTGVVWGYKAVTAKLPGVPIPTCEIVDMKVLKPPAVTVNVYNSGTMRGLAGRVSDRLAEGGFTIKKVTNTEAKVLTVLIRGAASDNPEVLLVAARFIEPQVESDGRPDHSVDVILGSSFDEKKGYAKKPLEEMPIPSGQICLPPSVTPTATPTPTPKATATPKPSKTPTAEPT